MPAELHEQPDEIAAEDAPEQEGADSGGGAAVAEPPAETETKKAKEKKPAPPKRKTLPPWKVLLHNDDVNAMDEVILALLEITPLNPARAIQVTYDAHRRGLSLILTTHRERAELFVEQFATKGIKVTAEPG